METRPEDINFEAWSRSHDLMVLGPVQMTLALLANLEAARSKVVSLTSQNVVSDWTSGGFYAYGACTAALNRAMKRLAVELKPCSGAVAAIHPGDVKTFSAARRRDHAGGERKRRQGGGGAPRSLRQRAVLKLERLAARLVTVRSACAA
jgi:NAD(P)-dependent dehydrogenase (short-subunit alcohol dehydrogenase family)